jgi:hypothetical protein
MTLAACSGAGAGPGLGDGLLELDLRIPCVEDEFTFAQCFTTA